MLFRIFTLFYLMFYSNFIIAQKKIYYEQLAFDFYSSKILDSFPVKKKIKVYKLFFDYQPDYFFDRPSCLDKDVWEKKSKQLKKYKTYSDQQIRFNSNNYELDFSNLDKSKFKIRRNKKGNYPKLFITAPHISEEFVDRVFVNIHEEHDQVNGFIYHLEFNMSGDLINWCRSIVEGIIIE